ncbi:MAG: 2-oxo acid dehydrogenase subunit E2 [Ruminococcaceae bacterium]|nr:2-oxo acid dehydrogenase subunit E2 [Oscillospiraceae bacterium]
MATPVIMPRQGQSVESCIIAKWHKKKGDQINVGDQLFTYETDKATFDEEATVAGTLLEVFFEEGDDVECLLNVCVIGEAGEDVSAFRPAGDDVAAPVAAETAPQAAAPAATEVVAAKVSDTAKDNLFISPRAKNHAEKLGVDTRFAEGSGPNGRVIERDIEALAQSGVAFTKAAQTAAAGSSDKFEGTGIGGRVTTGDLKKPVAQAVAEAMNAQEGVAYTDVPLTNIRKVISKAMHNSLASTAQLTLNTSFDATEIMAYRKKLKANAEKLGLGNITLNDIVLYAVSRTLLAHQDLNANMLDDKMRIFNHVNLGVAVDTPRGLMVPNIFCAELKSLAEISAETKDLAKACQGGTISPDLLSGGSFTVTNLGSFGIESFTPVLNAPQTGILGVDTIVQKAKEVDGEIVFYPAMGLSLTFDHRAVDGAPAAKFLQDLKANLENFSVLLAK